jgi:SAM-dependent methyltransferase
MMPGMPLRPDLHELNRRSWNAATRAHNSHKRDQARFLREGGTTLFSEDVELLGELNGKRLLHLCCNSGQDTLSLAGRHGATVTGVDISEEAISFARALSAESGIAARFERADVYDWVREAAARDERFDAVYFSYGAICWLSDLDLLFAGIGAVLAEGGRVVVLEYHPVLGLFDREWRLRHPYSMDGASEVIAWEPGVSDYVAEARGALSPSGHEEGVVGFVNPHPSFEFNHGLGAIATAIARAGLRIECMREYPYSNGFTFGAMRPLAGNRFAPPEGFPALPLMYGLRIERR